MLEPISIDIAGLTYSAFADGNYDDRRVSAYLRRLGG